MRAKRFAPDYIGAGSNTDSHPSLGIHAGGGIEPLGSIRFDGEVTVDGGISFIDLAGYAGLVATAASGGATITLEDRSVMTPGLWPRYVPDCVSFEISRTSQFNPEAGLDEDGDPLLVDMLTSHQFSFAVSSLGAPATLSLDIVMSTLTPYCPKPGLTPSRGCFDGGCGFQNWQARQRRPPSRSPVR